MNETRLLYCDICDKTINFSSRLRQFNSNYHIHKEEYGTVVEEYEFIKPGIDKVIYIFNDTLEDCGNEYFHWLEYRCVYDIKFKNMENFEEVISSITLVYMKKIFQIYGLGKKIKNARKNCSGFSEIVKLTKKLFQFYQI